MLSLAEHCTEAIGNEQSHAKLYDNVVDEAYHPEDRLWD